MKKEIFWLKLFDKHSNHLNGHNYNADTAILQRITITFFTAVVKNYNYFLQLCKKREWMDGEYVWQLTFTSPSKIKCKFLKYLKDSLTVTNLVSDLKAKFELLNLSLKVLAWKKYKKLSSDDKFWIKNSTGKGLDFWIMWQKSGPLTNSWALPYPSYGWKTITNIS